MKIKIPTTETTLLALLGGDRFCSEILMQAPDTNGANIFFGPTYEVDHFLEPSKSAAIPVNDLATYSVKGTEGDTLIISIYRG